MIITIEQNKIFYRQIYIYIRSNYFLYKFQDVLLMKHCILRCMIISIEQNKIGNLSIKEVSLYIPFIKENPITIFAMPGQMISSMLKDLPFCCSICEMIWFASVCIFDSMVLFPTPKSRIDDSVSRLWLLHWSPLFNNTPFNMILKKYHQ